MIEPAQAFKTIPSPTLLPTIIPDHREYVEDAGKRTLWVVFFIMILSTIAFIGMAWRVPVQKRLFHVLTTFITLFAAVSYFAMATGDGNSYTSILVHGKHNDFYVFRQIFWARYIDWSVTTPLLLLDLAFLAGVNGADIIVAIVADVLMILTGLFAAFGNNKIQKWGYYTMGCVFYIVIVYILAVGGRKTAAAKNAKTAKFFAAIGGFTFVLWTLYPVVWGLGDGSRILSVDSEIMAYAVLDVLAKPVFGFWLLITHARSDSTSIGGFWAHGLANEGALRLDDDEGA